MKKKWLACFLAAALCVSALPVTGLAEEVSAETAGDADETVADDSEEVLADDEEENIADESEELLTDDETQENATAEVSDTSQLVEETYGEDGIYTVYLPAGYTEDSSYPTVYIMPMDGYSSDQYFEDGIVETLDTIIEDGDSLAMIVVFAEFDEDDDYRELLDDLVADVESKYAAIADSSYRGILGVDVGGYMAYETALISGSTTFYAVASHMGDFTSEDNPWLESCGSVFDVVDNLDSTSGKGYYTLCQYYFYIDGPNGDGFTTTEGGTTDIGSGLEKRSNPYWQYGMYLYSTPDTTMVEFAVLDGESNAEFYLSSLSRSLNRFSTRFTENLYTAELSCTPQAVTVDYDSMTASVEITFDEDIAVYGDTVPDVSLTLEMIDPDTDEVLYTASAVVTDITAGETVTQEFTLSPDDMADGINTTLSVTVSFLGFAQEAITLSLVSVSETGEADEDQLIDLMGDWYFKAYKTYTRNDTTVVDLDKIENITEEEYTTWGVVQPALDWWDSDFDSSLGGNANYGGYAWYVRTFEVPEGFATEDLILTVGYFDEACEVYVNGVLIGSSGMDYTIAEGIGVYDGSNPWDTNVVFDLDSSVLNYGGTNTIAIRMCNSSGGGGWYEGPVGIYSKAAYNKASGLPSVYASDEDTEAVLAAVASWQTAVAEEDLDTYETLIAADYFESGYDKDRQVEEIAEWIETYDDITITDTSVGVFIDDDLYYYQADRVITGVDADGNTVEIYNDEVGEYYQISDGEAVLYGSHSRLFVDTYTSDALDGEEETFRVYLPEGYFDSDNTERYQVLYLLHGINSTSKTYEIDDIDQVLDEAIASGEIEEMIVIIPDDPTKSSFWQGDYADMVTDDLTAVVDERYRTIDDERYRYIAGCSMGGAGSITLGLYNPNLFSGIISFYGAFSYTSVLTNAEAMSAEYLSQYTIYMACGNQDLYNFYECQEQMSEILTSKGVEHYHLVDNGAHESDFYLPLFVSAVQYLLDGSYTMEGDASDLLEGTVTVEETEEETLSVSYEISVDDAVSDYLNTIVDSDYTEDTNPDLQIPVEIRITQDGVVVYDETAFYAVNAADTLELSVEIDDVDLDLSGDYTLEVYASVLESTVLIASIDTADDEEEDTDTTGQYNQTNDLEPDENGVISGGSTDDAEDTEDTDDTDSTDDAEDTEDTGDTGSTEDTEDTGDTGSTDDAEDTEDTEDTGSTDDAEDTEDTGDTGSTDDTEDTDDGTTDEVPSVPDGITPEDGITPPEISDDDETTDDGSTEEGTDNGLTENESTDTFKGIRKLSDGNWYYVENGTDVIDYTGLVKNDGTYGSEGWYYVVSGQVDFAYTGLVKYDGTTGGVAGWYYVKNGYVNFTKTGLVYNPGTVYGAEGWFYVENAYVEFSFSSLVKHTDGNWYAVKNAYVDFSVTGLVKNDGTYGVEGWYYVKNAVVDFSYNGLCSNAYGSWYVKNGHVDFTYSGPYVYNTVIFTIKGGQVVG